MGRYEARGKVQRKFYLPEALADTLRIEAAKRNESQSSIVEKALRRELGMVALTWQAWLGEMLMGEGPTEEAAIEAAVAEYERTAEYTTDPRDPHLFASREDLIDALEVEEADAG